ncbi:MAG: PTS glucose transporter subunit IIA [Oscillospiraceae bacterium]|jgi:glucose-specific phosphotransferase system IIA component|nr:PTS glucose transporter subunit IIA [Oscillospiraceae bacterium]
MEFGHVTDRRTFDVVAPVEGKVMRLWELQDEAFRNKMVGDGLAIEPSSGLFIAPISGKVVHVARTRHSILLRADEKLTIMVHMGLDTVYLEGVAFKCFVTEGQNVKCGDMLAQMDLEEVLRREKKIATPIILVENKEAQLKKTNQLFVNKHDILFTVTL